LKKDGLCDVKLNIRISCKIWLTWLTTLFTDSPAENKCNRYLQTMLWICWCLWPVPSQTSEITRVWQRFLSREEP